MASENFVTHKALNEAHKEIKQEIMSHVEKVDVKVVAIDNKVSQLNDLVLPMVLSMKQTADNTKEMSTSLKEFTRSQSETNNLIKDKLHDHDLSIQSFEGVVSLVNDRKKYNAGVIVALISLVGIVITGLFNLAPILFNQ